MTKLLTIYFDGAILAKFSTTPSAKTIDGTQKILRHKMMARTNSITMQWYCVVSKFVTVGSL